MMTLYHHPICPLSRQVRIYLTELDCQFGTIKEDYWLRRQEFLQINPHGAVPTIILDEENTISGIYPVVEYFVDSLENFFFMPKNTFIRAEIRKHIHWFNETMYRQVSKILIDEKIIRLMMRSGSPRSDFLKMAKKNLNSHFKYLSDLLQDKSYIIGDQISCADIAASSHISVIDYFGEIDWNQWPEIKNWYSLIKSRPGFKSILQDEIPGFVPPLHYSVIDF